MTKIQCCICNCNCSNIKRTQFKGRRHRIVEIKEKIGQGLPIDLVKSILQFQESFLRLEKRAHQATFQPTLQRIATKCEAIVLQCVQEPQKKKVKPPKYPSRVYGDPDMKKNWPRLIENWNEDYRLYYGAKRHFDGFIFDRATSGKRRILARGLGGWGYVFDGSDNNRYNSSKVFEIYQDRVLNKHETKLKKRKFYLH